MKLKMMETAEDEKSLKINEQMSRELCSELKGDSIRITGSQRARKTVLLKKQQSRTSLLSTS